jgi:hypothetical protein
MRLNPVVRQYPGRNHYEMPATRRATALIMELAGIKRRVALPTP